jgi:hypothetical protein
MWIRISAFALLGGCAIDDYRVVHEPNYDHLIGKRFSDVIYKGPKVYRVVRESDTVREFENRRSDGCIFVFGVRKKDEAIEYWRVDSGPGTCLERKKPLNR